QGPVKPEVLSIQLSGRRSNRRLQRNNSLSPNNPLLSLVNSGVYDEDCQWTIQVNRLQKLIDRLEQKEIRMEPVEEEVLESKSVGLLPFIFLCLCSDHAVFITPLSHGGVVQT
ncbi:hypothetical protein ILYODFUR_034901, partial [Ilyodon furcidens]